MDLIEHSYPKIFGFLASNIILSVTSVFLTQYILTKSFNWNTWVEISFLDLKETLAFLCGILVACILGSVVGATIAFEFSDHSTDVWLLIFRWFASNSVVLFTVTPFIISIKTCRFRKFRSSSFGRKLLVLVLILLTPIPIFFLAKIKEIIFSTVMGLYIDFPIVMAIYIYGGLLPGALTMIMVSGLSVLFVSIFKRDVSEFPFEERVASNLIFLSLMSITSLVIFTIVKERKYAIQHVENTVRERTAELSKALENLEVAKGTTEKLSKQKSTFMVYLVNC